MEAIEGLLGQFRAIHFHLQGWAQGLQPVWGGKVIICKRRRDKELSRQKSGILEKSKNFPTKRSPCLLMPLVTYTEGMPEFLEHQDTLCIRRRGTKLSNIGNLSNQEGSNWLKAQESNNIGRYHFQIGVWSQTYSNYKIKKATIQYRNVEDSPNYRSITPALAAWRTNQRILFYKYCLNVKTQPNIRYFSLNVSQ